MAIITVFNQKGGVGKTTTAVTLAHGLTLRGFNVLLVDLDAQGNVADCLGLRKQPALYQWLVDRAPLREAFVPSGRKGLDCILGDISTDGVEKELSRDPYGVFALEKALQGGDYEYILLDCAPSGGMLCDVAFEATDWLLIPTRCDRLAVVGVLETLERWQIFQGASPSGRKGELLGILPTFYELVTNESTYQLRKLWERFGEALVFPPIPIDVKLREAPAYGETIFEYSLHTRGIVGIKLSGGYVGGYQQIMDMIIEKTGGISPVQRARAVRRGI